VKLANSQGRWRLENPLVWTLELVQRLEASKDKIARAVNHWLDRIIGGFVTKFTSIPQLAIARQSNDFSKVHEVST